MSADLLLNNVRRTNVQLLELQAQLSSGLSVRQPSDAPGLAGTIGSLRTVLDDFEQKLINLSRAGGVADLTDQALADVSNLVLEAQAVASSQIGIVASAETRESQAVVVDALLDSLLGIANRQFQNVHLFAGRASDVRPFEEALGGIRYLGSRENLSADLGTVQPLSINTNGVEALGALSRRVEGTVDLNPDATVETRLQDVGGALGRGIGLGDVQLTVNASTAAVDLSSADNLGDVADLINQAITSLGGGGSLALTADRYTLTAVGPNTITIADIGSGAVAADLGIDVTASGGATAGADLDAKLTELTALAQVTVPLDLASGVLISNGIESSIVDFSGAVTIQDMTNTVANAGLGVRLEINDAATGLNLVNEVSGIALSLGENGGSTASDLGLRSFAGTTALADFNDGLGVDNTDGQTDFRIELADGVTSFEVDLDGAATVSDAVTAIENAAVGAGLTLGVDFSVAMAATGNGLVLTDGIGGAGAFRVVGINGSQAARDLGIDKNVGAATTLAGDDTATITNDSLFSHLIQLRDALFNNDERGITLAAEGLRRDVDTVAQVRATTGVRANRIANESQRVEGRRVQTESLLSDLRDTDFAEAVSRFALLQQQLEATLQSSSRLLQISLFNFLR